MRTSWHIRSVLSIIIRTVTPALRRQNYANTGGIQNTHIMATGQTGISEAERETPRTLSQWENLMLEVGGGAISGLHGVTGTSLAATVLAESDSFTAGDIGGTPAAAKGRFRFHFYPCRA